MDHAKFIVPPGQQIRLADYDTTYTGEFAQKKAAEQKLKDDIDQLADAIAFRLGGSQKSEAS